MPTSWNVLPEKFLTKLDLFISKEEKRQILESFSFRHPSTFRANTLKTTPEKLQKELEEQGIQTDRVSWYDKAFILKNVPQKVLTETPQYKNGELYIQSLSSMIPPLVLQPKDDDIVLDATAAPGSKTTQLAMIMHNKGILIANDKSRVRMFKLQANLILQAVSNAQTLSLPAEFLWKKYPEYFDKTLVDVPCSMEGRFYVEDPKTYEQWTPGKVKMLSEQQKWILRSAISATKPGGIIVYSTCTLSPEENEEIINWILKKEGDSLQLEDISIPFLKSEPGLQRFGHKVFDSQLTKALRIYPSKIMEGFFVAKIRKLKSTVSHL